MDLEPHERVVRRYVVESFEVLAGFHPAQFSDRHYKVTPPSLTQINQ
jgi:hypothetical protein